ncbi:hypothetical protein ACFC0M_16630 [Streptomyces sp. NPDC056149]|uniref:hypothetical protein n=1 Tax=unclassified Streptomyces TaxID=2593676 RepID=UPI002381223C|nr:hypothetical protein [Streptomyces sp. WZ-12]
MKSLQLLGIALLGLALATGPAAVRTTAHTGRGSEVAAAHPTAGQSGGDSGWG